MLTTRLSFLSLLALCGCQALTEHQRMYLAAGERAYRDKQYDLATEQLSRFLAEAKECPEVPRALYVRGMAQALAGRRAQAYADLQQAARQAKHPPLTWQPHVALGILYFEDENWAAALQVLSRAAELMPSAPPKDAVLFRIGLCNERLGRWQEAQLPYRRIIRELPGGRYAPMAERRLQLGADCFAVQCGVFARVENANQLAAFLQQKGFRPYVRPERRGGETCYVVLEGRYASYAQANAALAHVKGRLPQAVLWP